MAQPFDYTIPSPQSAFQASYAFGQQIAAQQQAQQQAQQKAIEAQQARAAMQMVYDNPTPENISRFYMAYPAYKEQFEAARQPLTDAAKADDLDFTSRALSLLTNGATDQANALMQSRIKALKETPGREDEAARTEAVAQMIAKEPQAGKALLGMKMAAIDSKLYENLFGKSELTAFQKNLVAAKIDPNSPEGIRKSAQFVELQIDPLVEMETPNQGKFIGRQSEYYRRYGTNAQQPSKLPSPLTKQQYDDLPPETQYFDSRDNSVKRKGGGSGNATGGFQ